ncbi:kinase-like domain-containing protein [Aspergillus stella-maris]|uniref:kinase-like domain-containing protein n=1 Tax=Aspergillus stella-maris TaxID=1810926 RepID=UPI003CCDD2E0
MKPSLPRLSSSLLRKKPFRFPPASGSPFPRPPTLSQVPNNDILIDEETSPFYDSKLFYPANPGDVLGRYQILIKVGWGVNSTVWFARDLDGKEEDPETVVALKICNCSTSGSTNGNSNPSSKSSVSATHKREIEAHISSLTPSHPGRSLLRTYLDAFEIQRPGQGSRHSCLVYPPMRETLARYQRRFEGGKVPLELGKVWIRALLRGLEYLHGVGRVVHTDLKPENILLTFESPIILSTFMETHLSTLLTPLPYTNSTSFKIDSTGRPIYPSQTDFGPLHSLKTIPQLIDFGLAIKLPEHDDWGIWPIQADIYRAPEVILGIGWRVSVDIWNLGVLMCDILSGQDLFHYQQIHDSNGRYDARRHMAQMISLLGPPPPEVIQRYLSMRESIWPEHMRVRREEDGMVCKSSEEYFRGPFFDDDGNFLYKDLIPTTNRNRGLPDTVPSILEGEEKDSFLDLAHSMLAWHPDKRKSAGELAEHPFLRTRE